LFDVLMRRLDQLLLSSAKLVLAVVCHGAVLPLESTST
jgi:hypothetical protein